jgi:hypothetical protein
VTIYLKLMHGRDDPDQHMDDWGFDGPVLGPFEAAHFTYATHVRCFPPSSDGDAEAVELCYRDDLLVHDGKYYGDFEIAASFGSGEALPDCLAANAHRAPTGGQDDKSYIYALAQLLKLFSICQERNINFPHLYREAERIADPERG